MYKPNLNYNLAEFVGILLGDGYICKTEVKISFDKILDKEYVLFVKKLIYKLFKIKAKSYPRSTDGTIDIRIAKKEFVSYLIDDLGLQYSPKHGRAIIPNKFYLRKYYSALARGYLDTDGCIVDTDNNGTQYPRIEMKICKSPMQAQYIEILKKLKFKFGAYNISNGAIRIQMNGKKELAKWMKLVGSNNLKNVQKANRFL
ncbi:hypothetical protein HZB00_01655 [Candidatus Woesearchaeota archaeon]|nr:hypothetical protein [Candidatus Woesearchaeota archaeon]